jgi:pectinesterase
MAVGSKSHADDVHARQLPADVIVSADGTGDYTSLQQAVSAIPINSPERVVIEIRNGTYREKVRIDAHRVTLRGESRDGVRIEFEQGRTEFDNDPDDVGFAVVNIFGDDVIIENITVENLYPHVGPHAFAIVGRGTRTIIQNADCHSKGADTVALWNDLTGMYYHKNCSFSGSVDLVCPRGWCYAEDVEIYERKPGSAAIWHDGDNDPNQKFVLRSCRIDGVEGFKLGRRHREAQFYLLDCRFSTTMTDAPIWRVTYPEEPERDAPNLWGDRYYFYGCRREGEPQFSWYADNLADAPGSPDPNEVTPAWTFDNIWDPLRTDPPRIEKVEREGDFLVVDFSEDVSVRGRPRLRLKDGTFAMFLDGSGRDRLRFRAPPGAAAAALDLNGGRIFACLATVTPRYVAGQAIK